MPRHTRKPRTHKRSPYFTNYSFFLACLGTSLFLIAYIVKLTLAAQQRRQEMENSVIPTDHDDSGIAETMFAIAGTSVFHKFKQEFQHTQKARSKKTNHKITKHQGLDRYEPAITAHLCEQLPIKALTPISDSSFTQKVNAINISFNQDIPPSEERDQLEGVLRQSLVQILPKPLLVAITGRQGFVINIAKSNAMPNRTSAAYADSAMANGEIHGYVTSNKRGNPYIVLNYDHIFTDELPLETLTNEIFHIVADWVEAKDEKSPRYSELKPHIDLQTVLSTREDWISILELRALILRRRDHPEIRLTESELNTVRQFTKVAEDSVPPVFHHQRISEDEFKRNTRTDHRGRLYLKYTPDHKFPEFIERRYILDSKSKLNTDGISTVEYTFSYAPSMAETRYRATPIEKALAFLEYTANRLITAYDVMAVFTQHKATEIASDVFAMLHTKRAPQKAIEFLFPSTIDYWTRRIGHPVFEMPEAEVAARPSLKK